MSRLPFSGQVRDRAEKIHVVVQMVDLPVTATNTPLKLSTKCAVDCFSIQRIPSMILQPFLIGNILDSRDSMILMIQYFNHSVNTVKMLAQMF